MNIVKNLHENCVRSSLTGREVEKLSEPFGGLSQKSWSKLTKDNFDEKKDGNITIAKLNVISKVLHKSPTQLLSAPGTNIDIDEEQLEAVLNKAYSLLLEINVIEEEEYFKSVENTKLLASAMHAYMTMDQGSNGRGVMGKIIKLLTGKSNRGDK